MFILKCFKSIIIRTIWMEYMKVCAMRIYKAIYATKNRLFLIGYRNKKLGKLYSITSNI